MSLDPRQGLLDKLRADNDAEIRALIAEQHTGPTGPRTQAGKQKSRLNAYRHGLCGKKILLFNPEEKIEFDIHCQGILASLAPVGPLETDLAQTIAEGRWRLKRSRALESNLYAFGVDDPDVPSQDPQERLIRHAQLELMYHGQLHKQIQLFATYEGRIQSNIDRSMAELRTLKAERQKALEEELLLAELAASKGETYEPLANPLHPEFVFSSQEIRHALVRKQRLAEARSLPKIQKSEPQTDSRRKK